MKKKNVIILAVIVVIIIGIVIGIFNFTGNNNKKEDKLQKIYDKLISSEQYSFKMEENDTNSIVMAKNGEETSIDQRSDSEGHLTSLIKDGNTYLIYHEREEYYVYERNNIEQNILTDGLKEIVEKEYVTGSEKVNGKKYTFEEYSGSNVFTSLNALNIVEEDVKTKFYFDKNDNLVYMRTTYGENEELLKIELTENIDSSLFEIPSNYAEN